MRKQRNQKMKTLKTIVNILGIDDKKYKEMRDIHLPIEHDEKKQGALILMKF